MEACRSADKLAERAGLLEVQGTFVSLIQLAEYVPRQRIAVLVQQTDPTRQPKHYEDAPGRLVSGRCLNGVEVR